MATFKIDDIEYDTDNLSVTQKRVVGLYQKALQDEGEALNGLEIARAARIELGRKLKELVIDTDDDSWKNLLKVVNYIEQVVVDFSYFQNRCYFLKSRFGLIFQ